MYWWAEGWTATHSADSETDIRAKMSRPSWLVRLVSHRQLDPRIWLHQSREEGLLA